MGRRGSPHGQFGYVTNRDDDNVTVVNLTTRQFVTHVAVGDGPEGMAVSPDGARLYVASKSGSATVINTGDNSIMGSIIGGRPVYIAVHPNGLTAYATNFDDGTVSVIDTVNRTITKTISVGSGPVGVAVSGNGEFVYVPPPMFSATPCRSSTRIPK